MGAVSLDVELQGFLATGLDFVREHPEVLEEVFERWKEPHLAKLYGQAEIDRVRRWVLETEIPVVLSWGLQNVKMPCLSIQLAQDPERVEAAALSDAAGDVDHLVPQPVIVPGFVPKQFDQVKGLVTVPKGVDLSLVRPGLVMVDAKDEEYLIQVPITSTSFTIDTVGEPVDPRKLYVKAGPGMANQRLRGASSRFLGHVTVGFHASADYQVVLWLYYIVEWILFRFKLDMERRGIQLQTFSGSEFNKDSKFLPENVYSRWMSFSAQVYVEWTEPQEGSASMFDLNLKADQQGKDATDPTPPDP